MATGKKVALGILILISSGSDFVSTRDIFRFVSMI